MKKSLLFVAFVVALFVSIPAQAQLRFGVRAGANISNLELTSLSHTFDSENVISFTGGLLVEYISPIGLGVDAGVMYTRMESKFSDLFDNKQHIDYIEVPINLKYKLLLPAVSNVIAPYIYAGPSFSFRVGDNFVEMVKTKSFGTTINAGLGLELFQRVQVSAQYGWGLTNAMTIPVAGTDVAKGKNRAWTITAAILF